MKSVIIITMAFVLLIPISAYSQTNTPQIGEVQWIEASFYAPGQANFQIIDSDQNLHSNTIDSFSVTVYSDTDESGIDYVVIETGKNSGIFGGLISLTTTEFRKNTTSIFRGHNDS